MKKQKSWVLLSSLIILTMLLSACSFSNLLNKLPFNRSQGNEETLVSPDEGEETTVPLPTIETGNIYPASFAEYSIQPVSLPAQFNGGYTLPLTEDQIVLDENIELNDAQLDALLENGFVVVPPNFDESYRYNEFYQAYETYRYSTTPIFMYNSRI